jgi:hypothetical protein
MKTDVLVIGGGATGVGVAWDAALRGYDVTLVERGDLAEGTSGRFHGLLHSGGRYVVREPRAAQECVRENAILRELLADCIEDTGGLFVCTPDDDEAYTELFLAGARRAGLAVEEVSIDAWKTCWSLARGAAEHGARILTRHRVVALHTAASGAITGARLHDEHVDVEAGFVLNASFARRGIDIVGTSTSCTLMLKREALEILELHDDELRLVSERTYDICEYLLALHERGELDADPGRRGRGERRGVLWRGGDLRAQTREIRDRDGGRRCTRVSCSTAPTDFRTTGNTGGTMHDDEHDREFSEGQEALPDDAPGKHVERDFAEGQEEAPKGEQHEGRFSEGQEERPHPEKEKGRFSEGQERDG